MFNAIADRLATDNFLFMKSATAFRILRHDNGFAIGDDVAFLDGWSSLECDQYMADGGKYRKRRHATFATRGISEPPTLMPYQPHYQTLDYNPLNGGVARYFTPIDDDLCRSQTLSALLNFGFRLFYQLTGNYQWHIELHQFRIEARDGQVGKPTPEGVHRDGVDFVMVIMVRRVNIESGATTIYGLDHQLLGEFTLLDYFDIALVNDRQVYHGVTPITPLDGSQEAYRDVLVITFRNRELG